MAITTTSPDELPLLPIEGAHYLYGMATTWTVIVRVAGERAISVDVPSDETIRAVANRIRRHLDDVDGFVPLDDADYADQANALRALDEIEQ
ncbi:MAG: hypothetical protein SGJ13_02050 [Actinomycetota bacterium]|nr:hypothetical protein [Actinomycetota bacterium]